ncbi:MAG: phytanoyl-CoA dioxygenase family protein [Alphaproteobacteria bacterium]|nr:phytanoyl-CoA dioxygenase family protein [Alphaproteobacteria bacterium]
MLSTEQVRRYRSDGIVFPITAMTEAEAAGYRARLEAFEAELGPRARQILRQKSHLALTWVDELIRLPAVLDAVEALIGPDIFCWSSSFFIKDPRDGKFVSWHQDAQYWGLEADDIVSAWIALTPSRRENGCLRVVPGTHLTNLEHVDRPQADNLLSRGQEIAVTVHEGQALDVVLAPGQFSLHHERIVHGSEANSSAGRRIGLAVRYTRPSARQVVEDSDSAMLVRGQDGAGNFIHEPRPAADMAPEAVAYLDALLSRRNAGIFRKPRPQS